MTGTTITGVITTTVTLGSRLKAGPLTIASTGTIAPAAYGAEALLIPANATNATVVNYGLIIAANGVNSNSYQGSAGGAGIIASNAALITNRGTIMGGSGGLGGAGSNGGVGGDGIDLNVAGDIVINQGTKSLILGGSGVNGYYGGAGGTGVVANAFGTLINGGSIAGGNGARTTARYQTGGNGGAGVSLTSGATLTVVGTAGARISGGTGGTTLYDASFGGTGGDGVILNHAVATNGNGIYGGAGGQSSHYGGVGGMGVSSSYGHIDNQTFIGGGAGGYGSLGGGNGGVGVALYGGSGSNEGVILGGNGGNSSARNTRSGNGGAGLDLAGHASFTNTNLINGGHDGGVMGALNGATGIAGDGVYVISSTFTNTGSVNAGQGFQGTAAIGGVEARAATVYNTGMGVIRGSGAAANSGGAGVAISAGSFLVNNHDIYGGAGAARYGVNGFAGGVGVSVLASTIINAGLIEGGAGGDSSGKVPHAGSGGAGISMAGGVLINQAGGQILGAAGGKAITNNTPGYGGDGGNGVYLNGGTLFNEGTIAGGTGGAGVTPGFAGNAVKFGTAVGTLVVETGAVFHGDVLANQTVADVLEFTGASTVAVTGIGEGAFDHFKNISFGAGAAWTIEGNTLGLTAGETIAGFAAGDTIILDGFSETASSHGTYGLELFAGTMTETLDLAGTLNGNLLVTNNGTKTTVASKLTANGVKLTAGETDYVLKGGKATKFTVTSGAGVQVEAGGSLAGSTVNNGGIAYGFSGGSMTSITVAGKGEIVVAGVATGTTVKAGGLEIVEMGGTASNTVLQGGTLEAKLAGSISGSLTFKGTGGALIISQTQLPAAKISGFASGDKIELLSAAAASGTVRVKTAGVVTVTAGGKSYNLNIAGATVGETDFKFSNYTLTKTAASMMFQRPDAEAPPGAMPELAAAGGHPPFAVPTPAPTGYTSSAIAPGALAHDWQWVANGGVQTIVTLQAG